ncbi:P-type conjugative transfer protein TrbJ [Acidiphilium sp. PA]|uniref:P-type conjugative transfer protein TrbJ n=1 Tax=Acidiphilium sp. PA TaxID=2871705 RepID=UPI0022449298|nr:P-type conjugative transfer protein TrbJ [Acidiphilium sp. PA]MCW8309207.1 P-type conjugative transfer protein TrbJ [Acidiphilium sp. PA]
MRRHIWHRCQQKIIGMALIGLMAVAAPISAQADVPVIDVSNLTQNVLTAARTLEEVNNQLTQLQQGISMLENQSRNLTSLPFSVLSQLQSSMGQINQLMGQAQSLAYTVQQVQQQFRTLYPNYQSPSFQGNVTQAGLLADANARWQASINTFQQTIDVQSQIVATIPADQADLSSLVTKSQGAVGALQAIQSSNQLLALQSRQLSATQDLIAADARAQAANAMQNAEVQSAAQAEWQRFYGNGVGYTFAPVNLFGGSAP